MIDPVNSGPAESELDSDSDESLSRVSTHQQVNLKAGARNPAASAPARDRAARRAKFKFRVRVTSVQWPVVASVTVTKARGPTRRLAETC